MLPPVPSVPSFVCGVEVAAPSDLAEEDGGVSACWQRDLQANALGFPGRRRVLEINEVVAARALHHLPEAAESVRLQLRFGKDCRLAGSCVSCGGKRLAAKDGAGVDRLASLEAGLFRRYVHGEEHTPKGPLRHHIPR